MHDLIEMNAVRSRPQEASADQVRFCSSCGETFAARVAERVCPRCGLGVLLTAPAGSLPAQAASFMVVTREMVVSAASAAAERLLGADATGNPLPSLLSGRSGNGELIRQVARAASGLSGTTRVPVTVSGRRGGYDALVSPCGPPRAALVVLERTAK